MDEQTTEYQDEVRRLQRRLERERRVRCEAEAIAERNLRELYTKQKALTLLQNIAMAANEANSIGQIIQTALTLICTFVDWPIGHAYLNDPRTQHLLPTGIWHGLRDDCSSFQSLTEQTSFVTGQGLPGRVLMSGMAAWIKDVTLDENFPRRHAARESGIGSGFAFPVLHGQEVVAILEFFDRKIQPLDSEFLDITTHISTQLSRVVERCRAQEQIRVQMDRLSSLHKSLQMNNLELTVAYDATIEGWSRALDLRDRETEGHSRRVTEVTIALAEAIGYDPDCMVALRRGALLHDIGKMGIPDAILLKAGPLSDDEWEIMRRHPQYAYDMLAPVAFLESALDIPLCHHEKWDGSGYPQGLRAEEIPLAARIFALVDVWDALRSRRPYRDGWPEDKVLEHISAQAGTHFDPNLVDAFLKLMHHGNLPAYISRAA